MTRNRITAGERAGLTILAAAIFAAAAYMYVDRQRGSRQFQQAAGIGLELKEAATDTQASPRKPPAVTPQPRWKRKGKNTSTDAAAPASTNRNRRNPLDERID